MNWKKLLSLASLVDLVLVLALLATLGPVIAFSDRGLDMSDEGIALTCSQYPEELFAATTAYLYYSHLIFALLGHNVGHLRIWGCVVLVASGIVAGAGVSQWLKAENRMKVVPVTSIMVLSIMGALFYYCYWLNVPTYNLYIAGCVTAGIGLVLMALVSLIGRPARAARGHGYLFLAGVLAGLEFFIKFPSAISSLLLYGFMLAVMPAASFKARVKAMLVVLAGTVAWFLAHFVFIKGPASVFKSFYFGYLGLQYLGHTSALGHYGPDMGAVLVEVANDFWPLFLVVGAGFALAELARRYWWVPRNGLAVLVITSFLGIPLIAYLDGLAMGGWNGSPDYMAVDTAWFLLLAWAILLSSVYFRAETWPWSTWRHLLLGGFVCGSATFAGAAGTGNNIYIDTVFNLGPWFAMLALMLLVLARLHSQDLIYYSGAMAITLLTAFQICSGTLRPYGLRTDYFHQTVPTQVGFPPTQLKLDSETSHFVVELQKICCENGFRPGGDVFVFNALPTVVYVLGGKTPGTPWLFGKMVPGGEDYDDVYLSLVPPERMSKAFIIEDQTCTKDSPNLHKYGVNFPENYTLCGTLLCPPTQQTLSIWKPKN